MTGIGLELAGFDQFLPVFLKHVFLIVSRACRTMLIRSTGKWLRPKKISFLVASPDGKPQEPFPWRCSPLDPPALGRAAAIVRNRGDIADRGHHQAHRLQ